MKAIFAVFFSPLMSLASNYEEAGKGTITGKVEDAQSHQPIEFATVSLHQKSDSTLVTGTVTDSKGEYSLSKVTEGSYFLRVGFIGYDQQDIPSIKPGPGAWQVSVPVISLKTSSTDLQEVEVSAQRSLVENKIDKKVFNAEQSMASQGGTGLDLMKEVPSVDVDADENISLRGDNNVRILVDGRPITIPASQFLKQLPANAIERVEIVTNPSAKYDPEGMSGILNVILKKKGSSGMNGNVSLNAGYGKKYKVGSGFGINYRKDKFNYSLNYNYSRGKAWYGGNILRSFVLEDTLYRQESYDQGGHAWNNHWVQGGIDFFANDFNTLYISANTQLSDQSGNRDFNNQFYEGGQPSFSSNRLADNSTMGNNYKINTGWQKKFKKEGETFDLDIDFSQSDNPTKEYNREIFTPEDVNSSLEDLYQRVNNYKNNSLLYIRNDFVYPLTDSVKLETGIHYTGTNVDQTFYSETHVGNSTEYTADSGLNNQFTYLQQVYAAYGIIGIQRKKLGYQVGLRAEKTILDAHLITTDDVFSLDYTSLFPSAHVSYKIKEMNELTLSYSRRINRPEVHEVNPFPSSSDPYTTMLGNPFLKPEFIHVTELNYLRFWDKFNINATAYYRFINDMKRRVLSLSDEGVSVVSFDNLAHGQLYGGELILTYSPKKWMRNTLTLNRWQNQLEDPALTDNLETTNRGWSAQLSSNMTLPKGWMAQVNGNYRSRMVVIQGILLPRYTVDLSVRKSILKKKGTLSFRVSDIFKTGLFAFESKNLTNYDFSVDRRWESRQAWLSFSYNFGKTNAKGRRKSRVKDASDDFSAPDMN
ncbi:MAG: TonB-dependent receptor [Flavobacteriales bacterium]|nr:TonB-dependent receptor [Flavobacteriales bacterium]